MRGERWVKKPEEAGWLGERRAQGLAGGRTWSPPGGRTEVGDGGGRGCLREPHGFTGGTGGHRGRGEGRERHSEAAAAHEHSEGGEDQARQTRGGEVKIIDATPEGGDATLHIRRQNRWERRARRWAP